MPYHFEIVRDDTASLSDKQFRLYHGVLERYWLRDCNIEITTLAKACQCKEKVLRALIDEVPSFNDIDGKFHSAHTLAEYERALAASERGKRGSQSRWKPKVVE